MKSARIKTQVVLGGAGAGLSLFFTAGVFAQQMPSGSAFMPVQAEAPGYSQGGAAVYGQTGASNYGQSGGNPSFTYDEQQNVFIREPSRSPQNGNVIFAPYVSDLRGEVMGNSVALFWQDSPSIAGPVYVYRSREPFYGGTKSAQIESKQVLYGTQSYTDTVPSTGVWYYLLVASDEGGQRYEMIVPFRNMVELTIDGGAHQVRASAMTAPQTAPQVYARAQTSPTPAEFRSQALSYDYGNTEGSLPFVEMAQSPITNITTTVQGSDIIIQFMAANTGKNAVLYRAINPIFKFGDLLVATVIKLGVTSPHIDRVTPGVPYYYAVVFEEDLRNGQAVLSPNNNTTMMPVETSRSVAGVSPVTRSIGRYEPLTGRAPGIPSNASPSGWSPPPQGQTLGISVIPENRSNPGIPASQNKPPMSVVRSPNSVTPSPTNLAHNPLIMEARVFNDDLQKPAEGTDEYDLSQIVQRYLMWRNWNEGRGALMNFLTSRKRSNITEARAHFYIGECAYFLGLYKEALSEFVVVQYIFPDEAAAWVQASLAKLNGK